MSRSMRTNKSKERRRHPAFGWMNGTITIAPGVDLTEPTCPHWEAYAEKKYGPDGELGRLWAQVIEREYRAMMQEVS